jgi:hypothetical protein
VSNMTAFSTRHALLALLLAGSTMTPSAATSQDVQQTQGFASSSVTAVVTESAEPAPTSASKLLESGSTASSRFFELAPISAPAPAMFQDRVNAGPNIALMAVGGAAVIIGLAIGGDTGNVIAATGGVMGLLGLYRYLK